MTVAEFLDGNHEDADFNQYWYSEKTISRIVEALIENGGKIAFLSTPSLYFSIPDELKSKAHVFDVSWRLRYDLSPFSILALIRSSYSVALSYFHIPHPFHNGSDSSTRNGRQIVDLSFSITNNQPSYPKNWREPLTWLLLIPHSSLKECGKVIP